MNGHVLTINAPVCSHTGRPPHECPCGWHAGNRPADPSVVLNALGAQLAAGTAAGVDRSNVLPYADPFAGRGAAPRSGAGRGPAPTANAPASAGVDRSNVLPVLRWDDIRAR